MPPRSLRRSTRKVYSNKYRTAESDSDDCVVISEVRNDEAYEDSELQSDPIVEEEEEPEPVPAPKAKAPAKRQRQSVKTRKQKKVSEAEDPNLSESILPSEETPFQEVALVIEEAQGASNPDNVTIEDISHAEPQDEETAEIEHEDDDPYRLIAVNGINVPQFLLQNLNLQDPSEEPENAAGKEKLQKVDPPQAAAEPVSNESADKVQFKKDLLATRDCLFAKMKTAALNGQSFVDARGISCDFSSAKPLQTYLDDAAAFAPDRSEKPKIIQTFLGEHANSDSAQGSAGGGTRW